MAILFDEEDMDQFILLTIRLWRLYHKIDYLITIIIQGRLVKIEEMVIVKNLFKKDKIIQSFVGHDRFFR
jgi:hypothetical protein